LIKGKQSYITQERIDFLNKIGFEFDPLEAQWMQRYCELRVRSLLPELVKSSRSLPGRRLLVNPPASEMTPQLSDLAFQHNPHPNNGGILLA